MAGRTVAGRAERKMLRTVMTRLGAGGHIVSAQPSAFAVHAPEGRAARPLELSEALMKRLLADGLVEPGGEEPGGGGWRISAAGAAWLRRALSAGDAFLREDAFLHQHVAVTRGSLTRDGASRPVMINKAESPLAWLRGRKDRSGAAFIGDAQFTAGERLRRDFTFAGLTPRMTASWDAGAGSQARRSGARGGHAQFLDQALDARQRFNDAVVAVGPELSGVLVDVCCFLRGLEEVEKARGWPRRAAKVILQLALDRLARHYGIGEARGARPRKGGIRHWGAPDYRPGVD